MNQIKALLAIYMIIACCFVSCLQADDTPYFPVKLDDVVNVGFRDDKADDRKGGWTDQGPHNDMSGFPVGKNNFAGIPFYIIDPYKNNGKSCLALQNRAREYFPSESESIVVNSRAQALYVLMGCAWNAPLGSDIATFIVRYKDATFYSEIKVTYGTHVSGWWNPEPVSVGEVAWKNGNGSSDIGVYSFGWVNPYPEKEISDMQLISAGGTGLPLLLAVTGIKPSSEGEKAAAEIRKREQQAAVVEKAPENVDISVDFSRPAGREPKYSIAFGLGAYNLTELHAKAAKHLVEAGEGKPVLFRYQVSTSVGRAEPSLAEGVWDFSRLDSIVDFIRQSGSEIMLCFGPGGPIWMAREDKVYGDSKKYWRPVDINEYAEYCKDIAVHYREKGITIQWEIGNEVELKRWPLSYYSLVFGEAAKAIKGISNELHTGGPASCNPNLTWAKDIISKYPEFVDFITYHQYGYSETFDTPSKVVMGKTKKYERSAREFRDLLKKEMPGKDIPLIVTESNINWRWQGGTDPRLKTMEGAAWLASVQGHFWKGGGDALCYFTFDGGFGCCILSKNGIKLLPTYHTLWLYRKLGKGRPVETQSNHHSVEAYGYDSGRSLILVNKNNSKVTVDLRVTGLTQKPAMEIYSLNETTYSKVSFADAENEVPELESKEATFKNGEKLVLEPFEVLGIQFK